MLSTTTLTVYDHAMVVVYLAFMLVIGWAFRHFNKNSSDYFRGGGNMLWWMAGSSAFMVSFSAVTFTGMAGKAYVDGSIVLTIFFANFMGFVANYALTSYRFRQLRVDTPMEAVRDRFGAANEQIFSWLQIPLSVLYAGIWLYGLGVFLTAAFGMSLTTTIITVGIVVVIMATLGGAWAVVASDFMQVLTLMPITIVAAFLALRHPGIGGVTGFLDKLPQQNFDWSLVANSRIVWLWVIAAFIQKFISTNNMLDASRYLCAKNSAQARKAAAFGAVLNFVGPAIWFIPPLAASILFTDLTDVFPGLGEKAFEGAYIAISIETMPQGMVGILICGIFAATMSSMDSGLNRNAGIFVKNFYLPVLRQHASDREQLLAGKITTLGFGILVILAALTFSTFDQLPIFDLMLQFGSLVALPYSIPLVMGVFVKRVPHWAAWSTVLIGFCVSFLVKNVIAPELARAFLGLGVAMTEREVNFYFYLASVFGNVLIGGGWFLATTLFYDRTSPIAQQRDTEFFDQMETPVLDDAELEESDRQQRVLLGNLCFAYGGLIVLMALIPNPWDGRLCFLFCGGIVCAVGAALRMQK
jgi:Na+/proline symporter